MGVSSSPASAHYVPFFFFFFGSGCDSPNLTTSKQRYSSFPMSARMVQVAIPHPGTLQIPGSD